jgi:hypothetical protein
MKDDEETIQVYWYRGRLVFRAKPSNRPSEAQLLAREAFGEAAMKSAGKRMEGDMPPAALLVSEEMTNRTFGGSRRSPKWRLLLVDLLVLQGYSKEEAAIIIDALEG